MVLHFSFNFYCCSSKGLNVFKKLFYHGYTLYLRGGEIGLSFILLLSFTTQR
jgi:hypothetical protein